MAIVPSAYFDTIGALKTGEDRAVKTLVGNVSAAAIQPQNNGTPKRGYEMKPYQGKTKDKDERCVKGWYSYNSKRNIHMITEDNNGTWLVIPETVKQLVCKDRNDKEVFATDKVMFRRAGFKPLVCIAVAGFESWVWLYRKDHSTYHWEIASTCGIELIKD